MTNKGVLSSLRGGSSQQQISTNTQGVLYMAASSLSFSLMFLGVKLYSSAPTFTLIFYRSIVQTILSGLLLRHQGQNLKGPANVRGLLTLRGLTGSLGVAGLYYAVQNLPLPDAITLQFTTPVFAAIMAVPMLGESWKIKDIIGAVFCMAGVVMIARPSWLFGASAATTAAVGAAASATTATTVGLVGAMFAAIAYVLVRRIGSRANADIMVFYYAVISTLTAPLGQALLDNGSWNVVGNPSPRDLLVYLNLGVFGFLGQLFTNMGLTRCDSAATATLITNTQIVFAFLFEILILHESISPWSIGGTALIVGYMAFSAMQLARREKQVATKSL